MNKERLTELAEKLLTIPEKISEYQSLFLYYNDQIQSTLNDIAQIESSIKSEISAQIDDNGKKVYGNAESREAAFIISARCNTELSDKEKSLSLVQGRLALEKNKMETLNSEQRNIRSILYFFGGSENEVF